MSNIAFVLAVGVVSAVMSWDDESGVGTSGSDVVCDGYVCANGFVVGADSDETLFVDDLVKGLKGSSFDCTSNEVAVEGNIPGTINCNCHWSETKPDVVLQD